jgi:hypothetical protein
LQGRKSIALPGPTLRLLLLWPLRRVLTKLPTTMTKRPSCWWQPKLARRHGLRRRREAAKGSRRGHAGLVAARWSPHELGASAGALWRAEAKLLGRWLLVTKLRLHRWLLVAHGRLLIAKLLLLLLWVHEGRLLVAKLPSHRRRLLIHASPPLLAIWRLHTSTRVVLLPRPAMPPPRPAVAAPHVQVVLQHAVGAISQHAMRWALTSEATAAPAGRFVPQRLLRGHIGISQHGVLRTIGMAPQHDGCKVAMHLRQVCWIIHQLICHTK